MMEFADLGKLDPSKNMIIPSMQLPSFRSTLALQRGIADKIMFKIWGGLGDQMCAEPTLRFALNHFKNCKIYLAAECPDLFNHLKFKRVFDLNHEQPIWENYFVFRTIVPPHNELTWEFFSHCITNAVDFSSLCALRQQLPIAEKELLSVQPRPKIPGLIDLAARADEHVFVHAGRHWESKTFPKDWWDDVLKAIKMMGKTPVLIGANTDDNRGTVDVDVTGCLDLRNQTTVSQTIWLLQRVKVLLTNDSAPLHLAATSDPTELQTGQTWIGFVATCKHPDYIQHWRKGQWAWRMKNFGKGGMWDLTDYCPNKKDELTVEFVDPDLLRSWLPHPEEFAFWAVEKTKE